MCFFYQLLFLVSLFRWNTRLPKDQPPINPSPAKALTKSQVFRTLPPTGPWHCIAQEFNCRATHGACTIGGLTLLWKNKAKWVMKDVRGKFCNISLHIFSHYLLSQKRLSHVGSIQHEQRRRLKVTMEQSFCILKIPIFFIWFTYTYILIYIFFFIWFTWLYLFTTATFLWQKRTNFHEQRVCDKICS